MSYSRTKNTLSNIFALLTETFVSCQNLTLLGLLSRLQLMDVVLSSANDIQHKITISYCTLRFTMHFVSM